MQVVSAILVPLQIAMIRERLLSNFGNRKSSCSKPPSLGLHAVTKGRIPRFVSHVPFCTKRYLDSQPRLQFCQKFMLKQDRSAVGANVCLSAMRPRAS